MHAPLCMHIARVTRDSPVLIFSPFSAKMPSDRRTADVWRIMKERTGEGDASSHAPHPFEKQLREERAYWASVAHEPGPCSVAIIERTRQPINVRGMKQPVPPGNERAPFNVPPKLFTARPVPMSAKIPVVLPPPERMKE